MNQNTITVDSLVTAINIYQRIHSDVQFETNELTDSNSILTTEHMNGEEYKILIEAFKKMALKRKKEIFRL